MSVQSVLIGIDTAPESAGAAAAGWKLAQLADSRCTFVHATRDIWSTVKSVTLSAAATAAASPLSDLSQLQQLVLARASQEMAEVLDGVLPEGVSPDLRVDLGRPGGVLEHATKELAGDLVIVGGKHHSAIERWLGGSTAHHLVRSLPVPVLVTVDPTPEFKRILVAIDLSDVSRTLNAASTIAGLTGAETRILHVVELLPVEDHADAGVSQSEFYALSKDIMGDKIAPLDKGTFADTRIEQGPVVPTIRNEVKAWNADLLVVGTHGRSAVRRMLLGSTAESLLNDLPTSMLFVPPREGEVIE